MNDMLNILKQAKEFGLYSDLQEFKKIVDFIKRNNPSLSLDWDDGAGEEWARLHIFSEGIVCMLHTKLRIMFLRSTFNCVSISEIEKNCFVVPVENYTQNIWRVDIDKLAKEVPEMNWHTSESAVKSSCFSLNDFYFATV